MIIQLEFVPKSSVHAFDHFAVGPVIPHQSTGSQLRASSVSIHSQVHSGDDRGEPAYIHLWREFKPLVFPSLSPSLLGFCIGDGKTHLKTEFHVSVYISCIYMFQN